VDENSYGEHEIYHEEQTADGNNGISSLLPINQPAPIPAGQFTIPSALVFGPVALPPNAPVNSVIPLEDIRSEIEESIDLM